MTKKGFTNALIVRKEKVPILLINVYNIAFKAILKNRFQAALQADHWSIGLRVISRNQQRFEIIDI
jgi:hypothetical protein